MNIREHIRFAVYNAYEQGYLDGRESKYRRNHDVLKSRLRKIMRQLTKEAS